MNTPHSDARPPRWAEAILRVLLKPHDRETVSGDLLEEYRDTIVPARGRAADLWYIRQVAWYLLRASWMWMLMGAALVFRYLLDTLVPAADYSMRASVLSWTILCVCLLAGFVTAWRTCSMRACAGVDHLGDDRRHPQHRWRSDDAGHVARSGDAGGVAEKWRPG